MRWACAVMGKMAPHAEAGIGLCRADAGNFVRVLGVPYFVEAVTGSRAVLVRVGDGSRMELRACGHGLFRPL
jgi:hypothetical protein